MLNLDSGLGIEIDGDRLLLASVKKGFQEYTLKRHLIVDNYTELGGGQLRNQIQQFLSSNGFNRENVVIGIPRREVIVRGLELPLEAEENLDQVVAFQVERLEPSDEEKSYFDYWVIDRDPESERIWIQILMVRQSLLDDYLALFQQLDLYPAAIRVGSLALPYLLHSHAAGLHKKKSSAVLLRVEEATADLIVLAPGQKVFSEQITVPPSVGTVNFLLEELHRFISELDLKVKEFSKIYLMGSAAEELFEEMRSKIKDTELLKSGLQLGHAGVGSGAFQQVLGAAALALTAIQSSDAASINLIPRQKRLIGERSSLVPTYILGGLLLIVLLALGTRGFFQQRVLLVQVNEELGRLETPVQEVTELRNQVQAREAELQELTQLMRGRQRLLMVVRDLTERIPDDTFLQTLQLQGNNLTLQGYSDSASQLPAELMESPHLASVKTEWITQDPRMQGKDRFKFSATIK